MQTLSTYYDYAKLKKEEYMATSTPKGRGWHGDSEGHRRAGQKGGRVSGGNFKNNPQRASEAGKRRGNK